MQKIYRNGNYHYTEEGKPVHREIFKQYYGKIGKGMHVHHIDGDSLNNNPENLIAITERLHGFIHSNFSRSNLPDREWIVKTAGLNKLPKNLNKRRARLRKPKQPFQEMYGPFQISKIESLSPSEKPINKNRIGIKKQEFKPAVIRRPRENNG